MLGNIHYAPLLKETNLINDAIGQAKLYLQQYNMPISYFNVRPQEGENSNSPKQQLTLIYTVYDEQIIAVDQNQIIGKGKDKTVVCLGQVLCGSKSNQLCAVKIPKEALNDDFKNEVVILDHLERLIAKIKTNNQFFLISQLCQGINLEALCYDESGKVKKILDIELIYKISVAIIEQVNELHQTFNVLHCDLKTSNVIIEFLAKGNIKAHLIDFGTSCFVWKADKAFDRGTTGYQGPEVGMPKDAPNKPVYSISSDFFSVGVIMAELLTQINYMEYRAALVAKLNENNDPSGLTPVVPLDFLQVGMPDVFDGKKAETYPSLMGTIAWLTNANPNARPIFNQIPKILRNLRKEYFKLFGKNLVDLKIELMNEHSDFLEGASLSNSSMLCQTAPKLLRVPSKSASDEEESGSPSPPRRKTSSSKKLFGFSNPSRKLVTGKSINSSAPSSVKANASSGLNSENTDAPITDVNKGMEKLQISEKPQGFPLLFISQGQKRSKVSEVHSRSKSEAVKVSLNEEENADLQDDDSPLSEKKQKEKGKKKKQTQ
ncbi:MAG: protein kinase family protein [Proteobacteria bacterium]|nr:protein kinase family protein [Pseudomonadota bacterium]